MDIQRLTGPSVRCSELVSALSNALDLAEGEPYGHALRSCLIGMRLGEALDLSGDVKAALYYTLLLKDAGGSSTAAAFADLFGCDDRLVKHALKTIDWTRRSDIARVAVRDAGRGRPLGTRLGRILKIALAGPQGIRELVRIRCERGAELVRRMGFPEATGEAIRALDEHWNGRGYPTGRRAEQIPLLSRIALLAQTADAWHVERGLDQALGVVRRRRGTWFDPGLVDALLGWGNDSAWWNNLLRDGLAEQVIAAEPADHVRRAGEQWVDELAEAFAEIIDAKTPFTRGNSTAIATRAVAIARECTVGPATQRRIYRAALLHDIGNLGVSNRILAKPGPLSPEEHKAIELHTVHTWEILSRATPLQDVAGTAALHHERLDGSGYPKGVNRKRLDLPARILAVADVYVALISQRPYRQALPPEVALALLRNEAEEGAFDASIVQALSRTLQETPSPPVKVP